MSNSKRPINSSQLYSLAPSSTFDEFPMNKDLNLKRVLVLHGKGSSGKHFRNVLSRLEEALQSKVSNTNVRFIFDYLTAPYSMSHNNNNNKTTVDLMEWWMLPPGVRSFQAQEYIGFQESATLVEKSLTTQKYDFIIGHSQGAILTSILMATSTIFTMNHPQRPLGCILNGVAWPNPFQNKLQQYSTCTSKEDLSSKNITKALFIIGKKDDINPPEGGERIRDVFTSSKKMIVETIYHEGGHSFPIHDLIAIETICKWIISVSDFTLLLSSDNEI